MNEDATVPFLVKRVGEIATFINQGSRSGEKSNGFDTLILVRE